MNGCSRDDYDKNNQAQDEVRFRKSVRSFLTYNLVLFIMMILGLGVSMLWKISLLWGAVLAIKGIRIFDKDRDDEFRSESPKREQYGRPRKPNWRKKDLV